MIFQTTKHVIKFCKIGSALCSLGTGFRSLYRFQALSLNLNYFLSSQLSYYFFLSIPYFSSGFHSACVQISYKNGRFLVNSGVAVLWNVLGLRVLRDWLLETGQSFMFELLNLLLHLLKIVFALGVELLNCESHAFLTWCKPSIQKWENGVGEESFLGFFTILVHGISDQGEIYVDFRNEGIIFVMSVRVHYNHKHWYELLLECWTHFLQDTIKVFHCKCLNQVSHGTLLLLFNPNLLEGLEEMLVELSHQSETSSLIEEIKLLIILVIVRVFVMALLSVVIDVRRGVTWIISL